MTKPSFNLDEHIVNLLRDEPFFAALSRRLEKISTQAVPTAGVKFNEDRCRFEMFYNPELSLKKIGSVALAGLCRVLCYP